MHTQLPRLTHIALLVALLIGAAGCGGLALSAGPTPEPTPTLPPANPGDVAVVVEESQFDAPGNDNENSRDEYVCLQNTTEAPVVMTRWQIVDDSDQRYTFPSYTLAPGAKVLVHTGAGTNAERDLYWSWDKAVWNNDGDTVNVYDAYGRLIVSITY